MATMIDVTPPFMRSMVERNKAIGERHRAGETPEQISDALGVKLDVVLRLLGLEERPAAPSYDKPMVREFSMAGPCIVLGELAKRTPKGVTYRTRSGKIERRGGRALKDGLLHVEPCRSCRDHPETQYRDGYMD